MTKADVINAFLKGQVAKNPNKSLSTDGDHLFSYHAQIAYKTSDGSIYIDPRKWSQTTSCHQGLCRRLALQNGFTVV